MLAFRQALIELDLEGGPSKRLERYALNHEIIRKGLIQMGFQELVSHESEQSKILNSFLYPTPWNSSSTHFGLKLPELFSFDEFYSRLSDKGLLFISLISRVFIKFIKFFMQLI